MGIDVDEWLHRDILAGTVNLCNPPVAVERWRKRLQDAMLESHFTMGQTRILVVGDPDHLIALCESLYEAGGKVLLLPPLIHHNWIK